MNSRIGGLSLLAVLQLLVIGAFWFADGSGDESAAVLLSLHEDAVTKLEISDGDNQVVVQAEDGAWQVAGVPADADKIDQLLDKLAELAAPWPVASTSGSVQRFEVGEDNYQRRLRILAGDELLGMLYLGTSPGYQRVHARLADSDDIYSVQLSNYELGVNNDAWLDKGLLALDEVPSKIVATFTTDGPTQTLEQAAEGWLYNDAAADADAVQTYANRFSTLAVLGLAAGDAAAVPLATIEVTAADKSYTFAISRLPAAGEGDELEGDYLISRNDSPAGYRLASYVAEQLLMTDAEFAATVVAEPDAALAADSAPDG